MALRIGAVNPQVSAKALLVSVIFISLLYKDGHPASGDCAAGLNKEMGGDYNIGRACRQKCDSKLSQQFQKFSNGWAYNGLLLDSFYALVIIQPIITFVCYNYFTVLSGKVPLMSADLCIQAFTFIVQRGLICQPCVVDPR